VLRAFSPTVKRNIALLAQPSKSLYHFSPSVKTRYSSLETGCQAQTTTSGSYPIRQNAKPMHLQPVFKGCDYVNVEGDVGGDIFERGLCLPSDIKMTVEQQNKVIELLKNCF
jgi:dTDP-4-amino-4,6-dideoxygalactose transaminase